MLSRLRSQVYLPEKRYCLLWLLDEMQLLYQQLHHLFELLRSHEGHRSSWLRRWWLAIGWCEDESRKERWPCRVLVGLQLCFLTDAYIYSNSGRIPKAGEVS